MNFASGDKKKESTEREKEKKEDITDDNIVFNILKSPIRIKKNDYIFSPLLCTPFILSSKNKENLFSNPVIFFLFPLISNKKNSKIIKLEPIILSDESYFPEEIEQIIWPSNSIEYISSNRNNIKSKEFENSNENEKKIKDNDSENNLSVSNHLQNIDKSSFDISNTKNNKNSKLWNHDVSNFVIPDQTYFDKKKEILTKPLKNNQNSKLWNHDVSNFVIPDQTYFDKKKEILTKPLKNNLDSLKNKTRKTEQFDSKNLQYFNDDAYNNNDDLSYPKPLDLKKIKPISETKYQKAQDKPSSLMPLETNDNQPLPTSNDNTNNDIFIKKDDQSSTSFSSLSFSKTLENVPKPSVSSIPKSDTVLKEIDDQGSSKAKYDEVLSNSQDINFRYEFVNQKDKQIDIKFNVFEKLEIKDDDIKPLDKTTLSSNFSLSSTSNVLDSFNLEKLKQKDRDDKVFETTDISLIPRFTSKDLLLNSYNDNASSLNESYNKLQKQQRPESFRQCTITINKLDIKIVDAHYHLNKNNRSGTKYIKDDVEEKISLGIDSDEVTGKFISDTLNKNYLWRYKVKL
jgi:hypothetical protein